MFQKETYNRIIERRVSSLKLSSKKKKVWKRAKHCHCDVQDCAQNHRLCALCRQTIIYTAYESNQPHSEYAWNIDHIKPKSRGGTNKLSNLQATHVRCNLAAADKLDD